MTINSTHTPCAHAKEVVLTNSSVGVTYLKRVVRVPRGKRLGQSFCHSDSHAHSRLQTPTPTHKHVKRLAHILASLFKSALSPSSTCASSPVSYPRPRPLHSSIPLVASLRYLLEQLFHRTTPPPYTLIPLEVPKTLQSGCRETAI
eukprot:1193623-Prorocentrum_minimum.AAC.6